MRDLRLEESGPGIGAVCVSEKSMQLSDVEGVGTRESGDGEGVVAIGAAVAVAVGEVLPYRHIGGGAIGAAGGKGKVDGGGGLGDLVSPPHEDVGDYAERRGAVRGCGVADEASEGGFEGGGGVEKGDDVVEG